jgi:uncharacterized protein YecE (DUF72 family)
MFGLAMKRRQLHIGTAGWSIPSNSAEHFPKSGSHLERYSQKLSAVEINSSFYKDHLESTYQRWSASVPEDFKFSVKLSKVFTHDYLLKRGEKSLAENLATLKSLGSKLGCILVQLPPSLVFDAQLAADFFGEMRKTYTGAIALEPRHNSWKGREIDELIKQNGLTRVFADPDPKELNPDQLRGSCYLRLHGSPEIYKSDYDPDLLAEIGDWLEDQNIENGWCIFDNTAYGFATQNALALTLKKSN